MAVARLTDVHFDDPVAGTISAPFSSQGRKSMPLTIHREIFDRVEAVIAETGRINMLSWAKDRGSAMAESVDEIRGLSLLDDCRTTSCIGGLLCYFATSEELPARLKSTIYPTMRFRSLPFSARRCCSTAPMTSMNWRMLVCRSSLWRIGRLQSRSLTPPAKQIWRGTR
jgi:hypothetical protein